jgi:hypothetical protein
MRSIVELTLGIAGWRFSPTATTPFGWSAAIALAFEDCHRISSATLAPCNLKIPDLGNPGNGVRGDHRSCPRSGLLARNNYRGWPVIRPELATGALIYRELAPPLFAEEITTPPPFGVIMAQHSAHRLRIHTTVCAASRFAILTATSCSSGDQGSCDVPSRFQRIPCRIAISWRY